ncbi:MULTISPECIES: hypothetical protein [unclassified Streptomyces]|uniref:hypothetical protein n=1 Tax=unclassified Streptomyces TaxID=2593676 RepID=UPI002FEEB0A2
MTTFTDDFDRPDSSSLGAAWVEVSGDWSIISGQLSSGSAGGTIILRAAGAMATSDNSAQVTIAATAPASHGVWCRGDDGFSSGYLWRNNGDTWDLFSVVGGSFTLIGTYAAAAAPGDVAKIEAVGSTIKGYVNGVVHVSVTDTFVTSGTSVGIRAESTNSLRFDDFTGADVVTGSTGDAALSGVVSLSASGTRGADGSSALSVTAGVTASGQRGAAGDSALTATAALTASGQRATTGDASLASAAALSAAGTLGLAAGGTAAFVVGLHASGQVTGVVVRGTARRGAGAGPQGRRGEPDTPHAQWGIGAVPAARGGTQ